MPKTNSLKEGWNPGFCITLMHLTKMSQLGLSDVHIKHYIKHFRTLGSPKIAKQVHFGLMGTWERAQERDCGHGNVCGNLHIIREVTY